MSTYRAALAKIVSRLGADPAEQEAYLRRLDLDVDELALEFDDLFCLAKRKLSTCELAQHEYDALIALNNLLQEMSGKEKAHLWTVNALRQANEWAQVRRLASKVVAEIGKTGTESPP